MESNKEKLSTRHQRMVVISSFTATNNVAKLRIALDDALNAGLTKNEINEELAHLYAYCGFGPSIRAINVFKDVVSDRQSKGINDDAGKDITPISENASKYDRGEKAQMIVTGLTAEQLKTLFAFNPVIDVFLKEHLFADIFDRDILSYIDREIITVSALVSMVDTFIQSHISGALNVGVTESQLRGLLQVIETNIGKREADTGRKVLDEVVLSRNKLSQQ
jgi:4-carboxymuconolactone decarboxylase